MNLCPCCSNKPYNDCCGRFIDNGQVPTTPEQLMRSRYSAYANNNLVYLENTMKSPAADQFDKNTKRSNINWIKLEVLNSSVSGKKGKVEYIAYYNDQSGLQSLHEKSQFRLDEGHWYYIDGEILDEQPSGKIGRNSLCPCGSGKKFKKCCLGTHRCGDAHCTLPH